VGKGEMNERGAQ